MRRTRRIMAAATATFAERYAAIAATAMGIALTVTGGRALRSTART